MFFSCKIPGFNVTGVCIIHVLMQSMLSVGIILGFLSNAKISSALDTYTSALDAAIQDGTAYIDNTLDVCCVHIVYVNCLLM